MAASFFLWLFMLPYSTLYSIMTMGATLIFWREEGVDVRKMMGHKRSPCSVDQSSYTSIESKRQKANDLSITAKERKEKLSERIVALQQLVSPYGKTDTSSVLEEAMQYIGFLHRQVKLLSAPYLESSAATKDPGLEPCSLRSRGLCLVPVSLTIGVAESNGADIWAPIKTTTSPPKFEKEAAQFQS
ncbi:transcription factor bHLH153 isoform X1 [Arachis ipaensis]|uniref:transcription factor bHLH153 isoform X1 n=1 Tax=Arachis ipaensis TaxID=130454 RepID=UPI000A2B4058|nr:transcription factor bHLH153 isoform X1 [Arachis ipaensis]XP_025681822.1 transcription factor bHLH153 isoform X1 [Arachis hypogaea]